MQPFFLIFLFLLALLYCCNCSEFPLESENVSSVLTSTDPEIADSVVEYSALYNHEVGIFNLDSNCYINALLFSLYNIPFFQRSVFKTISEISKTESSNASESSFNDKPVLVEIGHVFKEMRINEETVDLSRTFFNSISRQMEWEVGRFECVLEFWDRLIDSMPETHKKPFQENFEIKFRKSFYRKEDGRLIKSVPETSFNFALSLKSHNSEEDDKTIKLGELFISSLEDNDGASFAIEPEEYPDLFNEGVTEPQSIQARIVVELENSPPVLVLSIKRLQVDPVTCSHIYNDKHIEILPFSLGDEEYIPLSVVAFKKARHHYINYSLDASQQSLFLHDDTEVFILNLDIRDEYETTMENIGRSATLVFCIKASLWSSECDSIIEEANCSTDINEAIESLRSCESLRGIACVSQWFKRINRSRDDESISEYEGQETRRIENSPSNNEYEIVENPEAEDNDDSSSSSSFSSSSSSSSSAN